MGDTKTLQPPTGDKPAPALDPSVSEFLALTGGAKTGTRAKKAKKKTQSEYDKALREATPGITEARAAGLISARAKKLADTMEASLKDAAKAKGDDAAAVALVKQAAKQAADAKSKGQESLRERHAKGVAKLGDAPGRIAAMTGVPAPATQALKAATDARDAAKAAVDADPPDWPNADALVKDFDQKAGAVAPTCLAEASKKSTAFAKRYKDVDDNKPAGKDIIKKYADYSTARKTLDRLISATDGLGALGSCAAAETALSAFEKAAAPSDAAKQKTAKDAFEALKKIKDSALAKMTTEAKAELAMDLCANGTPTGKAELDELCRLYKKSPPDKAFLKKREDQRTEIVDKVSKMPEIATLFDNKGKLDKAKWSTLTANPDTARTLLAKIADVQADALGIPRIPVNKEPDPPQGAGPTGSITFGGYNPATNAVNLNLHKDCLNPPEEALTTILHEMFHAHQDVIVKKLKAGDIAPGDPDYPTALMYMVNDIPIGYVFSGDVGQKNYERQPTEIDAEYQGKLAAKAVLKQVAKAAKSKK